MRIFIAPSCSMVYETYKPHILDELKQHINELDQPLFYNSAHYPLTQPKFCEQAYSLAREMYDIDSQDLQKHFKVKQESAFDIHGQYEYFLDALSSDVDGTTPQAFPALLSFSGVAYQGFNAQSLSTRHLLYAQRHLRILSALYGILKPLDGIYPYRLDFAAKIKLSVGSNLYKFWGAQVAQELYATPDHYIINLASDEYLKLVAPYVPQDKQLVHVHFYTRTKSGAYKKLSYNSKMLRGMLARYIIENELENPLELYNFTEQGYHVHEQESNEHTIVFYSE